MASDTYHKIYAMVRQIPAGKVATYGQIARLAGLSNHARQVGYALNAVPEEEQIPWHRVINAQGRISKRANPVFEGIQRELLEQEGIVFEQGDRIPMSRYQWNKSRKRE